MFDFNKPEISEALDERISELLTKMETITESEDYTKATNNLAKLMDLRNNALKTQNEKTKVENEKIKIDQDQVSREQDHSINVEKIVIEKDKIQIEKDKIQIERDKLDLEEGKFEDSQESRRSWKPSPDAVVGAAASVVGIVLVLHFEKIGVITSKALGFIGKMTK